MKTWKTWRSWENRKNWQTWKTSKNTYVISIHTDGYQWLEGSAYWESPTLSIPTTEENKKALKDHLEGKKKQRKGV